MLFRLSGSAIHLLFISMVSVNYTEYFIFSVRQELFPIFLCIVSTCGVNILCLHD